MEEPEQLFNVLHDTAKGLHFAGLLSDATIGEFDALSKLPAIESAPLPQLQTDLA
jgi:hypothetical protein